MKQLLRWFAGASSFLFVLSCLNPTELPHAINPIEDSWLQALHLAFVHHLQFGREIVFTFGPWGFLYGGYRPETHFLSILIWLALATIFWLAVRQIARFSFKSELAQWVWIMGLSSIVGITIFVNNDVRLVCWPLLLLILHFFHEEPSAARIRNALIVSLGLISLIKFTIFLVGLTVILAIAADTIFKRKRFPWGLPLYAASIVVFWLLAAQKPSSFWPYLVNSWQVASGYTEAMMSNGLDDLEYAGYFVAVALMVITVTSWAMWKRLRFYSVFALGAFGLLILSVLKYGFVRAEHEGEAALQMIAVSLLCLAVIWPVAFDQRWWFRIAGFLPIGAACVFTVGSLDRFSEPSLFGAWAATLGPSRWLGPIEVTYLGPQYNQAWEQQFAACRYQSQLPSLKGDTDYYSSRQIQLFASGIPYRPRPVFQSYCAFTPALAKMNAAHLRSDNAAQFIVFDNFALDKHYRSLEDGFSWPELLTRYDVQEVEFPYTVLSRSATPRKFNLIPISDTSIKLGQPFSMPAISNAPIWAEIEVNRTLAGSAISAMFKPPMLYLQTTLRSKQQFKNEFLPGLARTGFLLSPRVADSVWFAALRCDPWPRGMLDNEVTSFCVYPATNRAPVDCYQDSVRVRLYRLEFPPQHMENAQALGRLAELRCAWQRKVTGEGCLIFLPDEGSILSVPPDSHIRLRPPEECSHLKLGFGLSLFNNNKNVPGVTYRASTLDKQQRITPLWSQHIDPKQSDQNGRQVVSLDLGTNELSNVLIETIPDGTNSRPMFSPYWYQIHFE